MGGQPDVIGGIRTSQTGGNRGGCSTRAQVAHRAETAESGTAHGKTITLEPGCNQVKPDGARPRGRADSWKAFTHRGRWRAAIYSFRGIAFSWVVSSAQRAARGEARDCLPAVCLCARHSAKSRETKRKVSQDRCGFS